MNYEGLLLGVATFVVIGIFHPIVIKTHYYFGTRRGGCSCSLA